MALYLDSQGRTYTRLLLVSQRHVGSAQAITESHLEVLAVKAAEGPMNTSRWQFVRRRLLP